MGDQIIAPAAIEHEELMAQFRRWPEWHKDSEFKAIRDKSAASRK